MIDLAEFRAQVDRLDLLDRFALVVAWIKQGEDAGFDQHFVREMAADMADKCDRLLAMIPPRAPDNERIAFMRACRAFFLKRCAKH